METYFISKVGCLQRKCKALPCYHEMFSTSTKQMKLQTAFIRLLPWQNPVSPTCFTTEANSF